MDSTAREKRPNRIVCSDCYNDFWIAHKFGEPEFHCPCPGEQCDCELKANVVIMDNTTRAAWFTAR